MTNTQLPLPPGTKLAPGATVTLPKGLTPVQRVPKQKRKRTYPVSKLRIRTTTNPATQFTTPLDRPANGGMASRRSMERGLLGHTTPRVLQPPTPRTPEVERALHDHKVARMMQEAQGLIAQAQVQAQAQPPEENNA